jgi:hypothetical protein
MPKKHSFQTRVSGFDRIIGLSGLIFFKLKWCRFSKKQKSTGCNWVFDRVTPGFSFSYFFFNPVRFQPRVNRVPSRPVRPGQVSKLCEKILNRQCLENKSFFASFSNLIHDLYIFIVTETKFLFINFSINLILENFLDTAVIT